VRISPERPERERMKAILQSGVSCVSGVVECTTSGSGVVRNAMVKRQFRVGYKSNQAE
jgi:hypothetical protein